MYLYHVLFTLINIYGIDCQKKIVFASPVSDKFVHLIPMLHPSPICQVYPS
jgi:hypothetical protein